MPVNRGCVLPVVLFILNSALMLSSGRNESNVFLMAKTRLEASAEIFACCRLTSGRIPGSMER